MKRTAFFVLPLLLSALVAAQDATPESDGGRILNDLTAANEAKDSGKIDGLLKGILDYAKTSKEEATLDALADQLDDSLKVCKGNWGTLRKIVEAMGELRSKKGVRTLKKLAFQKDPGSADEQSLQAAALTAIALMVDTKNLDSLVDMTKSHSVPVAKAAYEAFRSYAGVKGKVRRDIAEELMKRLEAENPTANASGGISAEQKERFDQLKGSIVSSMQAICRQPTINDVENWREWWRENKKNAKAWKDEAKE